MKILKSKEDSSVNFVFGDSLECRFVQRAPDYFIIYVSSQTGCNQACRFCFLTQMKQTTALSALPMQYHDQIERVSDYYLKNVEQTAKKVHVNFMARGEPLENPYLARNVFSYRKFNILNEINDNLVNKLNIPVRSNISTIIPNSLVNLKLTTIFKHVRPDVDYALYYSMYSARVEFRKRWLPKAMQVNKSLDKLKEWQDSTGRELVFHHAFIKDENDSLEDVELFLETIRPYNFKAKFNLVRYNPYSPLQGAESDDQTLQRNFDLINSEMSLKGSRIVPRVGKDVAASCGQFISAESI